MEDYLIFKKIFKKYKFLIYLLSAWHFLNTQKLIEFVFHINSKIIELRITLLKVTIIGVYYQWKKEFSIIYFMNFSFCWLDINRFKK